MKAIIILAFAFIALSHSSWAACPSYTFSLQFQILGAAAESGMVSDGVGNQLSYSSPAIPPSTSVTVPMTLTPACSGGTAFVTGETLGTLRNDPASAVGFYILVGGSPITVTDLGRWVVSGNTGQHAVSIYDSTCKALGTATVNTSGAPSGAFAYASLSTPITLAASQHYYVMSAEGGGDQWYNSDTVLATTSAASVVNDAYMSGGVCFLGGGFPIQSNGPGHSNGFPSFKYH